MPDQIDGDSMQIISPRIRLQKVTPSVSPSSLLICQEEENEDML